MGPCTSSLNHYQTINTELCYSSAKTGKIRNNGYKKSAQSTLTSHSSTYGQKKERLIDNCLVLFIGIQKYETGYNDINNIDNDEDYYKKTFELQYNYDFISNNYSESWTADKIEGYIREQRKKLIDCDGNIKYNGLVVCLSGHGFDGVLVCSDGAKLPLKNIRSEFCDRSLHPNINNIPKIFIVDKCRSNDDLLNNVVTTKPIPNKKNYSSTIVAGTEGTAVCGSLLAKAMAKALAECPNISFQKVYKYAGKELGADTNGRQQLTLNEHDYDIDDVRFTIKK